MSSAGYAYSERPTPTETTLWTNNSPTSSMADSTTITLSSSVADFDYIRIESRKSTSDTQEGSAIYTKEFVQSCGSADGNNRMAIACNLSGTIWARTITCTSNTSFAVRYARKIGSSGSSTANVIPTRIVGIKMPG